MQEKAHDYTKLKALLEEQETFPTQFTYKFIGKQTDVFKDGVASLEKSYPGLKSVSSRASANGAHLALTYSYDAHSADAIIDVLKAIHRLPDLLIIL